jgi:hypothetical protein
MRSYWVWKVEFRATVIAVAAVGLLGAPESMAQGGPPMLTDDPGTPGAGNWEINTAVMDDQTAKTRLTSLPHVDVNFGVGEHIQLKYETGYLLADTPAGGGVKTGLDDSLLGVKWRFLDQQRAGVDVSVYPQLEVQNSHSALRRGIAQQGTNLLLPVELNHDFGRFSLDGEAGYQYLSTEKNQWIAGILGAAEVSSSLELLAELRSVSQTMLSGGDLVLNAGLRQQLGSHVKLLASAGAGLRSGAETTRFIAYLGFQWLSGEQK